jgi:hypothetical protein
MSTPLEAIIAQLFPHETPAPGIPNAGVPASANFGVNGAAANTGAPSAPASSAPIPPEDLFVSPDPLNPRPPDVRMEGLRRLLANFTYSLGTGLETANANPRGTGQRTQAGIGAILTAPMALQKAQQDYQQKQAELNQKAAEVLIQAKNAQTNADMVGPKVQGMQATIDRQNAQTANDIAKRQQKDAEDVAKAATDKTKDQAQLRAKGLKRADDGTIIPVDPSEMTPAEQADLKGKNDLSELRVAQTQLALASAEAKRQESDPNSPAAKLAAQKEADAAKRLQLAEESLGIRRENTDIRSGQASTKYYDAALHADDRLSLMQQAAGKNYQGTGGQGDYSLLFNHIGMTLSQQKGARINNAEVQQAINARSLPESILAQLDRLANGKFLSPDERRQMVENGITARERAWYSARRDARLAGISEEPQTDPSLPAMKMPGNANPQSGGPIPSTKSNSAAAQTIEQYSPSAQQYRYSTDGGKTWNPGRAPK